MEEDNIVVEGLNKKLDHFQLTNVSFRVPKGRIVGFIGENGAGKSTTIQLILDEMKKDSGKIEILDLFLEFIQDEEHSLFFSSHITTDIEKIADYVILIHQGRIIFEVLIPLLWTGISLPLAYWLGSRSSQVMGILVVFPMVHLIGFFEEGHRLSELPFSFLSYAVIGIVAVVVIFGVSYMISVIGYNSKNQLINNR